MRSLPHPAVAYIFVVMLAGCAAAASVAVTHVSWAQVVLLTVLFWASDFAPVVTRTRLLNVSTSFPVAFAAVLLAGPAAASFVCLAGTLGRLGRIAWYKRVFNACQVAICAFAAGWVYDVIPGGGQDFALAHFPRVLVAAAFAGFAQWSINQILVAIVIRLTAQIPLRNVWNGMSETAFPSLGYGFIGLMIAVLWAGGVGPVAGLLVLAPMLIARWAFKQYGEQHKAYEATVASLIRAVETKDYYTRGHSERVSKASVMLAEKLNMRGDRLEMLRYAGMLHDVGKLGVPTKLLQKTGPLDDEEFAAIKLHPTRGVDMVTGIEFLDEAMQGIRHHHERIDGLGYPDGLKGDEIPEFARAIAVADAFDSMTSTRSYRGARSVEAAIAELRHWSGTQFDPVMVGALIAAVEERGWETSVGPVPETVDPSVLVPRDHDDPSADVAAAVIPSQSYGQHAEAF